MCFSLFVLEVPKWWTIPLACLTMEIILDTTVATAAATKKKCLMAFWLLGGKGTAKISRSSHRCSRTASALNSALLLF